MTKLPTATAMKKLEQLRKFHWQGRLTANSAADYMELWGNQMEAAVKRKDIEAVYKLIPFCPFMPVKEIHKSF